MITLCLAALGFVNALPQTLGTAMTATIQFLFALNLLMGHGILLIVEAPSQGCRHTVHYKGMRVHVLHTGDKNCCKHSYLDFFVKKVQPCVLHL